MDKFKATWVSHSSIADFLKCPRFYFLRNVYKDPRSGRKMTVMTPHLALGLVVHDVVEGLSFLPVKERFLISPVKKFEAAWGKVAGERGGFFDLKQESAFKERGTVMLKRLEENPGPLLNKAIKIKTEDGLPYYWFSEEEGIILCGKVDWIEHLPKDDSVHLIEFKTGRGEEDESSLQLPIYLLIATNTQKRKVAKASYWYLDRPDGLVNKKLSDIKAAHESVDKVARRIKLARQINHFKCPTDGCRWCRPLERVLKGEGKKVGISAYGQDIYVLKSSREEFKAEPPPNPYSSDLPF